MCAHPLLFVCVCVCVCEWKSCPVFFFFYILCNFIAIFFSAWPSHLARLALAISKWLCSIFIVNFCLCMYLSIVNFSGHEIKIVVVIPFPGLAIKRKFKGNMSGAHLQELTLRFPAKHVWSSRSVLVDSEECNESLNRICSFTSSTLPKESSIWPNRRKSGCI